MIPHTEKEIWQNTTKGTTFVLKYNNQGHLTHDVVYGGKKVDITPYERQINSDRAYDESLDVFKNGTLIPVKLVDTAEDLEEIKTNPNLRSESDLRDLFSLQWKKFDDELATISNSSTLVKLLEIAEEQDATVRQLECIKSRLRNVDEAAFNYLSDTVTSHSS